MRKLKVLMFIGAAAVIAACTSHVGTHVLADEHGAPEIKKAVAVLIPTLGSDTAGYVAFEKVAEGVKITAHVTGLEPGQKHGFHIHEWGDQTSPDGLAAGGHFNPGGAPHAGPASDHRHVGDLGNLEANDRGEAHYERIDTEVSLDMTNMNCVIGRGVVVHEKEDDLSTQPTGDAGPRIAVGVVGIVNPE